MTREIKFRAWDEVNRRMISAEGLNWEGVFLDAETAQFHHKDLRLCYHWLKPLQYTGLKDINGVEIYEGDILTSGCAGEWGEYEKCVIVVKDLRKFYFRTMQLQLSKRGQKVIGNTYENPELLENLK